MRVLLLTHRIPYPPDKGDKIRSFHVLRALAGRHDVRLITHADDPTDVRYVPDLRKLCGSVSVHPVSRWRRAVKSAAALLTGRPLSFARFHERAARAEIAAVLRDDPPDVVVVFSAQPAEYLPEAVGVPVIVDMVDVDSEKWASYAEGARGVMRLVFARERRLVREFERSLVRRGFRVALVTEREAALFRRVVADVPVAVVPNGVEIDESPCRHPRVPGLLVFVGAMDYAANRQAAEEAAMRVLPIVRRSVPGARLRIVGRNPGSLARTIGTLPGVEVTGEVANVLDELDRAAVSLIPLHMVRGVPNKLLESFARGVPVVTTRAAIEAVGGTDGEHALVADSPEGLARAVVALLRDPVLAARVGEGGRRLVRERFRWDRLENGILELVEASAREAARA